MTATATDDTTAEKHTGTVRDFRTVTVTPERIQAYIGPDRLDDEFSEHHISLYDTEGGVTIATEGADPHADPDADMWGGSLVELDAEQARLLADALYQAADEMDGDRA